MDGNGQFTKILHASCDSLQLFRTWPEPVIDMLFINLPSAVSTATCIQLYDSKGALVKKQMARLLPGNNVISMDVKQFSAGIYFLHFINSNGVMHVQQLIKN
ncbi:MAG TPA: T9SS type A sorting domain-containing protein [Chitinophagaceae bacterium]|nr:T9SS type A sorting domain-containing protein [Chitinophagaceae bacterium]